MNGDGRPPDVTSSLLHALRHVGHTIAERNRQVEGGPATGSEACPFPVARGSNLHHRSGHQVLIITSAIHRMRGSIGGGPLTVRPDKSKSCGAKPSLSVFVIV